MPAQILQCNTFTNFSLKKGQLHFQEVKVIQYLEFSFGAAFFTPQFKYKMISAVILHPQSNKASKFISTTLKYGRNSSRYIQPPRLKTFIQLHYISSIEYKL